MSHLPLSATLFAHFVQALQLAKQQGVEKNNRPSAVLFCCDLCRCAAGLCGYSWLWLQAHTACWYATRWIPQRFSGCWRRSVLQARLKRKMSSTLVPNNFFSLGLFCFSITFVCFAQNSLGAAFRKKQFTDCTCSYFRAEWSLSKFSFAMRVFVCTLGDPCGFCCWFYLIFLVRPSGSFGVTGSSGSLHQDRRCKASWASGNNFAAEFSGEIGVLRHASSSNHRTGQILIFCGIDLWVFATVYHGPPKFTSFFSSGIFWDLRKALPHCWNPMKWIRPAGLVGLKAWISMSFIEFLSPHEISVFSAPRDAESVFRFWNRLTVHCTKLYTVWKRLSAGNWENRLRCPLTWPWSDSTRRWESRRKPWSFTTAWCTRPGVSNLWAIQKVWAGISWAFHFWPNWPNVLKLCRMPGFKHVGFVSLSSRMVRSSASAPGSRRVWTDKRCRHQKHVWNWSTLEFKRFNLMFTLSFNVSNWSFSLSNFKVRKSHPDWNGRFCWGFADRSKVTQASNRRTNEALPPLSCQRMQSTGLKRHCSPVELNSKYSTRNS